MATSPLNQQQHHQQHKKENLMHSVSFLKWGNKSHAKSLHHRTRRPPTDLLMTPPPTIDQDRRLSFRNYTSPLESREGVYDVRRFTADREDGGVERTTGRRFDFEEKGIQIEEESAELQKLWNLRPRKTMLTSKNNGDQIGASSKVGNVNNGGFMETVTTNESNAAPKSLRLRGMGDGGCVEKKNKKAKLWISLSKEEIEEDIFILTGSKPVRRPKRRPKTLQKQLDIVLPGQSLLGATADSFKIPDILHLRNR